MIKKTVLFFVLMLFCVPIYAKAKLKVYPNPWIPESGKSLSTSMGDEKKHGSYTADGWIKFEGVAEGIPDDQIMRHGGTLRIYDITGHLIRSKRWTIEDESKIPLPETSHELTPKKPEGAGDDWWPQPEDFQRNLHIVHWDGKNNNYEYVESGVYIWIIEEDNGHKHDGKVVVIR
ncbi:hypothetical protein [Candidatus Ruminimicrobiellum ovillum]|uniref:hypothetical protein n=1 Tax=Candidatus Ruminimicrobiellum ovillum TaxID=1947927 RepID=UPI00355A07A0